jgi:putative peptidoglycan lipid II flippase
MPDGGRVESRPTDDPVSGLLRSNLVVATGTALSRVTGLLRVVALGYVLGQTALADAYKLANETPNIVYELLLGGVLSATLVPLFSTFAEDDDEEATNVVLSVSAILMVGLTVVAVVAAPFIFGLYSINVGGDVDESTFRSVGTTLARIFLVQILFYGLVALMNAFLNSRRRFFAAAWSPIFPNLVIIVALLSLPGAGDTLYGLSDVLDDQRVRLTLGLGATLGIASMLVFLVPAALRTGFDFRFRPDFRHPAVGQLLRMSAWTIGFVIANQIALVVVRNLADPGSGIASAYFDAFTFFVLPHGLLAVSIATTFQPELARSVARRDKPAFIDQASLGIRMTALLTIPAGVGIFVLRRPIVGALLQHGNFDATDARNTSRALAGFALGLAAFSIYLFVLRGFYAHKDTRTPFTINVVENAINIALAFLLVDRYGVLGLGLAFALAYAVSSLWAMQVLGYKVAGFSAGATLRAIAPMVLAAILMGEAVWVVARSIGGDTGMDALVRITVGGVSGIVVYLGILLALRVPELDAIRTRLRRT